MESLNSPFIIPVVAMMIPIVAIVGGIWSQAHARRVKADQRMAMLARGMSIEEIERVIEASREEERTCTPKDPLRSLGNARRAGIVLVSVGVGLIIFGCFLTWIVGVREVYSVAAAGLIPLAIGIGFFIDYNLQKRELSRFGMELDTPTTH
jgi:hypothetical protein